MIPLKSCLQTLHTQKKLKKGEAEEDDYFFWTEPTWEHKALSGTGSILCARCKSILWKVPEKGAYQSEETL